MDDNALRELTAHIVSAYVEKNPVQQGDLPALITNVSAAINSLGDPQQPVSPALTPPVPIKKSITPDFIVSLEDGKRYKSMKRHLSGRGLTPDEYRAKWGLPGDYPMVAPNYSAARSALAKTLGLGRKPAPEPVKTKRARKTT